MPRLRFPEFDGEWEDISFSDLFEILSNNTLSRAELSECGDIKNIHYGDVLIKYGDTLDIASMNIPFVNPLSKIKRNDAFLSDGDVIIADTAEDETVGKSTEIYNVSDIKVVSGLHTIPCRPKLDLVSKYLGFYLNSPHFHRQLLSLMQGVKVLSISKSNIATTVIYYPTEQEQQKIVNVMDLLDKRIAKQRELVESLKLYKRGALSKLFPRKGENAPQCRFAGFTEPWEQYKLGELLQTIPLKPFLKEPEPNGTHEVIQQGSEPIIGFANGAPCSEYKDVVIFGDHTLSLYKPKHPFFVATDGVRIVKGKQDTDGYYLLSLLEKYRPQSEGYKRYYSILTDACCVTTYNAEEQKQMGLFFANLDHLITLHQRKLNEFETVKAGLLQQLFI